MAQPNSSFSQMVSVSYPAVIAKSRSAANQWAESSVMRIFEDKGFITREDLGPTIDMPLDYQRNPGTVIQTTELQALSMTQTEVVSTASYTPAEVTAPIVWSKKQEATNPSRNQKIALVKQLLTNAIASHDDILEQALFATSTNGFLGFGTHIPTSGQSSDGGIDSTTYTFWRNQAAQYVDDTDIESAFTRVWNACAKGTGSKLLPTLMVADSTTQALFEGTQQALQRYDSQDMKSGFKTIMFKTAQFAFSPYGGTSVYFLNSENFQLVVSKQYFRDLDDSQPIQNANGFVRKIYSAAQTGTNNRSRLGVCYI